MVSENKDVMVGPAGRLKGVAPLTYPHLESLGLVETVSCGENIEFIQDGASAEPLVLLINEQSLQRECQSQIG